MTAHMHVTSLLATASTGGGRLFSACRKTRVVPSVRHWTVVAAASLLTGLAMPVMAQSTAPAASETRSINDWLTRMHEASRQRAIAAESDWMAASPKARQAKGKARLAAYDKLHAEAMAAERGPDKLEINIPAGPRLGDNVIKARAVNLKASATPQKRRIGIE